MAHKIEADVCVVGAGFAGLTVAWRLVQAGQTVVVLEARDRVGGRTWTDPRDGFAVDRGGAWLNPKHSAAFALAAEMEVTTYKTYVAGSHLLLSEGKTQRYKGLIPKISPLAVLQIAAAQWRIDRMAKKIPLDAPWDAAGAKRLDQQSVGDWLAATKIRSKAGYDVFEMAVRGLFAAPDMGDVSMLNLAFLVGAHEKIEALFSIEGGAQENLVQGGMGALAQRVADRLDANVHLSSPVQSITHGRDKVVVAASGTTVTCRYVVVAVPPVLASQIAFDPPLPDDRRRFYEKAVAGCESKTNVVYERPFWREDGYSGQSAGAGTPSEVTIDASPSDGAYGVLASFNFGRVAERVDALADDERRQAVLAALVERFGPQAGTPVDFVETAWWQEDWTRGCSMAHYAPGLLTTYGHLLREPMGRIHWAGTETATISHGAVDGAIRSGERAAQEVLELLDSKSTSELA